MLLLFEYIEIIFFFYEFYKILIYVYIYLLILMLIFDKDYKLYKIILIYVNIL